MRRPPEETLPWENLCRGKNRNADKPNKRGNSDRGFCSNKGKRLRGRNGGKLQLKTRFHQGEEGGRGLVQADLRERGGGEGKGGGRLNVVFKGVM